MLVTNITKYTSQYLIVQTGYTPNLKASQRIADVLSLLNMEPFANDRSPKLIGITDCEKVEILSQSDWDSLGELSVNFHKLFGVMVFKMEDNSTYDENEKFSIYDVISMIPLLRELQYCEIYDVSNITHYVLSNGVTVFKLKLEAEAG